MGRRSKTGGKKIDDRDTLHREGEPFGSLFHCVYLSSACRHSTLKAKALFLDLIYQYRGRNNGKLVLCPREKCLKDGFTVLDRTGLSETSLYRAAAELEARGHLLKKTAWHKSGTQTDRIERLKTAWASSELQD